MPSKSRAQQRLFQAAAHGAKFAMAKKVRASMSHAQLKDFTGGSMTKKPEHVPHHGGNRYAHLRDGK